MPVYTNRLGQISIAFLALAGATAVPGANTSDYREAIFHATGVIQLSREHTNTPEAVLHFEVDLKGNRWLIRTVPADVVTNTSNVPIADYQAGTDGTSVFSLEVFNPAYNVLRGNEKALMDLKEFETQLAKTGDNPQALGMIRNQISALSRHAQAGAEHQAPRNQAVGKINPGIIPEFSPRDLIAPIWLALCSTTVIGPGMEGTNLVPALFQERSREGSRNSQLFAYGNLEKTVGYPHLPSQISFSNRVIWITTGGGKTNQMAVRETGTGFIEADYKASFKEIGDLIVPSAFEVRRYSPPDTNGAQHLWYTITGKITEMQQKVGLTNFLPQCGVVAAIEDNRHRDDISAESTRIFTATNNLFQLSRAGAIPGTRPLEEDVHSSVRIFTEPGEWPSVAMVHDTKEYSDALRGAVIERRNFWRRRSILILAIALIGIMIALMVWTMTHAARDKQP